MMYLSNPSQLMLAVVCASVCAGVVVPSTSLETLPVVYMGGNAADRGPKNIEMLSKMRYVVIEKWEGHCWNDCLENSSKHIACSPSCNEEQIQMATLKAVKAVNPKVAGVFYLNTILDFHFLHLHKLYVEADALIHNVDGTLCELINDNGMKNITVFDYSKEIGQKLWLAEVENLTKTGLVDGFYGDTMQVYAVENKTTGLWELCKKGHHTCCEMTAETAAAYNKGKAKVMQQAYEFLGADSVFFKMSDLLAGHKANPSWMNKTIQQNLKITGHYVHLGGDERTSHDPNNTNSTCSENMIAAFLLAVEPGAFLGCNGWDAANMGRPLGDPLGPAQTRGTRMWRNFSTGTSVTWDLDKKKGSSALDRCASYALTTTYTITTTYASNTTASLLWDPWPSWYAAWRSGRETDGICR